MHLCGSTYLARSSVVFRCLTHFCNQDISLVGDTSLRRHSMSHCNAHAYKACHVLCVAPDAIYGLSFPGSILNAVPRRVALVPCCIVHRWVVLRCAALRCAALCWAALCCAVLRCAVLCSLQATVCIVLPISLSRFWISEGLTHAES